MYKKVTYIKLQLRKYIDIKLTYSTKIGISNKIYKTIIQNKEIYLFNKKRNLSNL